MSKPQSCFERMFNMKHTSNQHEDPSIFRYSVDMWRFGIYGTEIREMMEWCREHHIDFYRVVLTFYFKTEQDRLLFIMRFK